MKCQPDSTSLQHRLWEVMGSAYVKREMRKAQYYMHTRLWSNVDYWKCQSYVHPTVHIPMDYSWLMACIMQITDKLNTVKRATSICFISTLVYFSWPLFLSLSHFPFLTLFCPPLSLAHTLTIHRNNETLPLPFSLGPHTVRAASWLASKWARGLF